MTLPLMRIVPGALVSALALVSPTAAPAQDDVLPVVDYRQSVMQGLAAHQCAVTAIVNDEVEYRSHILAHAMGMQRLAVMATDIFPEGSGGDDSSAKDEIWQDRDEFREVLKSLQDATRDLVDAVYAGDIGAVEEAVTAVDGSCQNCHEAFVAGPELECPR